MNFLFLKLQSAKIQLNSLVKKIRDLVVNSRSSITKIYTEEDAENESHFNAFRRQVEVKGTDLFINHEFRPVINFF